METDEYYTIGKPSEGIYKERGSTFMSFAYPVSDSEAVKALIKQIKKEHYESNHHCYAFRLGVDGKIFRSSDDREPAGSAGKPILGQLLSHQLTDTLIIVARYFGGIQLGIPGLIQAYKHAANDAIIKSQKVIKTVNQSFQLSGSYQFLNEIMIVLKSEPVQFIHEDYNDDPVMLKISIRKSRVIALLEKLKSNHALAAHFVIKELN